MNFERIKSRRYKPWVIGIMNLTLRKDRVVHASKGDRLVVHGRVVGQHDRVVEIVEVLGPVGSPPYRVRTEDGHETIMFPGPDSVVDHRSRLNKPN